MISNSAFVTELRSISIAGVTNMNEIPQSVTNADLPVCFPVLSTGELSDWQSSCQLSNVRRSSGFVILITPVAQGTLAENFTESLTIADAFETALLAADWANWVDFEWRLTADYEVGDTTYWAITATISIRDF